MFYLSQLGNLINKSTRLRDRALELELLSLLLPICAKSHIAAWAVTQLCRSVLHSTSRALFFVSSLSPAADSLFCDGLSVLSGDPPPDFSVLKQALPMLARLLHSQDTKLLERALSALEALSDKGDGRDMRVRAIVDSGATDKLVELLGHHKLGILAPALQIVSLMGADALRDKCIAHT